MKRLLRILGNTLGIFVVIIFALFHFLFIEINYDKNIKNDQRIKNLDKKVFRSFGFEQISKSDRVSTDFTFDGKQKDTVNFTFHATQSNKCRNVGQFKIHSSTSFNGQNIFIYRLKNRFRTEIEEFSDNYVENEKKKRYKIISQHLILDKEHYNENDSVFGKLEIQFEDVFNNTTISSISYFQTKVQ